DAELNKTYQSVLAKLPTAESKQKLRKTQRAWVASRDAEGTSAAGEAEGGSMAPTLRYGRMRNLTQERIKELNAMLDHGAKSEPTASTAPNSTNEKTQSVSDTKETSPSGSSLLSPDKKWEYKPVTDDRKPHIVKAGTNEAAGDLSCDYSTCGDGAT